MRAFPSRARAMRASPRPSFDQNFADPNFADQNFAKPNFADASFPERRLRCKLPRHELSRAHGFAHQEPAAAASTAQPAAQADQGFDSFHRRGRAGLRPGAAKRPAAAAAGLRRHLRPAAADFARLDRAERAAPRRISTRASGSTPISSTRVRRFRARRPRQVGHDVQGPQRLHGRQRAARRHRSRRGLGLRL